MTALRNAYQWAVTLLVAALIAVLLVAAAVYAAVYVLAAVLVFTDWLACHPLDSARTCL